MNAKYVLIGIVAVIVLAGGVVFAIDGFTTRPSNSTADTSTASSIVDGKQIINITAKGGYSPRVVTAKANMPTVLRVATSSTFDCSSALSIPAIGYKTNLPQTGTTDIPIPPQKEGTSLKGLCAMGMYNFTLNFN